MPELFAMLDGQHIGISIYHVSDYYPHPDDGRDWFDVIPTSLAESKTQVLGARVESLGMMKDTV